jgi:hypothetical protein
MCLVDFDPLELECRTHELTESDIVVDDENTLFPHGLPPMVFLLLPAPWVGRVEPDLKETPRRFTRRSLEWGRCRG